MLTLLSDPEDGTDMSPPKRHDVAILKTYVNLKVREETVLFARSKLYLFLGKLVWFLRSPFCPKPIVGRFVRC
jgi:hypothetical protein